MVKKCNGFAVFYYVAKRNIDSLSSFDQKSNPTAKRNTGGGQQFNYFAPICDFPGAYWCSFVVKLFLHT